MASTLRRPLTSHLLPLAVNELQGSIGLSNCRCFASRPKLASGGGKGKQRNTSKGPGRAPKKAQAPKSVNRPRPKAAVMSSGGFVPPALLAPTASKYAYISKAAVPDDMDSSTIFAEATSMPDTFKFGEFDYLPPQLFGHELPNCDRPEVVFLGRSNVGKSSLINALIRKSLCKTSKYPGRTQLPYYYGLFPSNMRATERQPQKAFGFIVDLPGYGFARAPEDKVDSWQADTQNLLLNRRDEGVLQRLFLLIDSRRGASQLDRSIMDWMDEASIPYSIVLTKADRVSMPSLVKNVNELCMRYESLGSLEDEGVVTQSPIVHLTSSKKKDGLNELMISIETEFYAYDDNDDDE